MAATTGVSERFRPPSELLHLTEPVRAAWELGALHQAEPWLNLLRGGDGHPVMVIPGFTAGGRSTKFLRDFLSSLGYSVSCWNQGINFGIREELFVGAMTVLDQLYQEYECKVSLVGQSLGGIYAREIAKLCRKAVTEIVKGNSDHVVVTPENLEDFLGVRRFKYGLAEEEDHVGVTTGLAWTEVGGDLLSIEALKLPGKGRMKTTGKLGDVMKESARAALSYCRSRQENLGVAEDYFEGIDIHVHVPAGAIPKDGPSAGIALVTAIVSALSNREARSMLAMTGEISLRGRVLPVGGIKGKVFAAARAGIDTVVMPRRNAKDLVEIPDDVHEAIRTLSAEGDELAEVAADTTQLQCIRRAGDGEATGERPGKLVRGPQSA